MSRKTLSDAHRATLLTWAVGATLLGAGWLGLDAALSAPGPAGHPAPVRLGAAARDRYITTRTRAS